MGSDIDTFSTRCKGSFRPEADDQRQAQARIWKEGSVAFWQFEALYAAV